MENTIICSFFTVFLAFFQILAGT